MNEYAALIKKKQTGKPTYLEENLFHCHSVQQKIPCGLTCKRNWAYVVRGTRTACCLTVSLRSILILSSPTKLTLYDMNTPICDEKYKS
jgi:hypothetical protein